MANTSFERVALEAVRRARAWCEKEGDPTDFRAFEAYVRRCADVLAYRDVARSLGMSAPDVRRRVTRVRERIREELRGLLGGAQGDP